MEMSGSVSKRTSTGTVKEKTISAKDAVEMEMSGFVSKRSSTGSVKEKVS